MSENKIENAEEEEVEIEESVSDEPEPITEEEAAAADITVEDAVEAETPHLTSLVCAPCLKLNLLTKSAISCARCGNAFCLHFASTVDAQYCVNCMSDISITKQVITKSYEHTNPETGAHTFYRRRAREIKIEGLDWLFAQRKIAELSDVELDLSIEYHRNIEQLMIAEQERRRNVRMHRFAGVAFKIPKTPSTTSVSDSTTTTVKKTRTVSKNKAAEQLAVLLKQMQSKGKDINKLAEMIGEKFGLDRADT